MNKKTVRVLGVIGVSLVAGCASIGGFDSATNSATSAQVSVDHYLILKGSANRVVSIANDDDSMFVMFDGPVSPGIAFFDNTGKSLSVQTLNNVANIEGLHREVLIKNGDKISFVAVREGAELKAGPKVKMTPTIQALKSNGENKVARSKAQLAMAAALAVVNANGGGNEPTVTVEVIPPKIDWTAQTPLGLPASAGLNAKGKGYLTFVDGSLQPVQAVPVVRSVRDIAQQKEGVILVSGITPSAATPEQVSLASRRAEFVKEILIEQGIAKEQITLTAVFRTDAPGRNDATRPSETVSIKWLESTTTEPGKPEPEKLSKR